jgi:hypothetical protein
MKKSLLNAAKREEYIARGFTGIQRDAQIRLWREFVQSYREESASERFALEFEWYCEAG